MARRIEQFALTFFKTIGPAVCVLMLAGVVGWRREFARVERWPLLAMAGIVLASVAVKSLGQGVINGRYFLTISLLAAPCDALAFSALVRRLASLERPGTRWRPSGAFLAGFVLIGSAAFGWAYALATTHPGRAAQVALGERLRSAGSSGAIVADARSIRIAYTAGGGSPVFIESYAGLDRRLSPLRPRLLLLSEAMMHTEDREAAHEAARRLGLARLDPASLPKSLRDQIVFVRREQTPALAN